MQDQESPVNKEKIKVNKYLLYVDVFNPNLQKLLLNLHFYLKSRVLLYLNFFFKQKLKSLIDHPKKRD